MTRAVVFIDFDGTISPVDISNTFFTRFAGRDAADAVEQWKQGLISSCKCLERELDALEGDIESLREFAREQPIDKGFYALREECLRWQVEVIVVSDGLDFYIEAFFARYGLDVCLFSNRLEVVGGHRKLEFPYHNAECGACGNCKSSHVERAKQGGKFIVYIGDGLSDKCAVGKADLVFAKGDLGAYCTKHGIPHVAFENLTQVTEHLKSLDIGTPLSKR